MLFREPRQPSMIHTIKLASDMRRSSRLVRSSHDSLVTSRANNKIHDQEPSPVAMPAIRKKRSASLTDSDVYESYSSGSEKPKVPTKKQKTTKLTTKRGNGASDAFRYLFNVSAVATTRLDPCILPERQHSLSYHRPLLLDRRHDRTALLEWFDSTFETRGMPWRRAWIDPSLVAEPEELRQQLEKRAYEVWISEIMLQQTRVAVVIEYWNRWMAKWPTIHELAAASSDDVLAMWRGLGYYSRATRIHEAAKLVCGDQDMEGLLPHDVVELEKKVPGVGRYTAGAITAIVFGKASPMVDGNVLRVLSRQLGLLGDVKTDKANIDLLWMAAESLVKAVARDDGGNESMNGSGEQEPRVSDRPGRWGQALMELGSTICTPKPNCAACPITDTCRAYAEGLQNATQKGSRDETPIADLEDACNLCKPFAEYAELEEDDAGTPRKVSAKSKTVTNGTKKQASLQSFFFAQQTRSSKATKTTTDLSSKQPDTATLEKISNHARKFPVKTIKKAVREEETLVCAIRRKSDGQYLIQKRPEKGLLAGLWEFPSHLLSETSDTTAKRRKADASKFIKGLLGKACENDVDYVEDLGSVPWLFSHIKLTMHVHLFELLDENLDRALDGKVAARTRWTEDVDGESMGTGMRKCWALVKDSAA